MSTQGTHYKIHKTSKPMNRCEEGRNMGEGGDNDWEKNCIICLWSHGQESHGSVLDFYSLTYILKKITF